MKRPFTSTCGCSSTIRRTAWTSMNSRKSDNWISTYKVRLVFLRCKQSSNISNSLSLDCYDRVRELVTDLRENQPEPVSSLSSTQPSHTASLIPAVRSSHEIDQHFDPSESHRRQEDAAQPADARHHRAAIEKAKGRLSKIQ